MIDHDQLNELIAESGFDDSLQALIDRCDKAEAERDELKAKLSNGIRMHVRQSPHSGIWADTVNCVDRQNCTVVLDDEVEL